MTFTEAAVEVLRREGKPLHFRKIAEIAIRENLLDHVGKIPEDVMGGQLANHCRLPRGDRTIVVVQAGTFALVEWGLDEDPAGLDGIAEPPAETELPYRGRERHPVPSREVARSTGRGERDRERPRRREEQEEKRRRFPPPAEVAYEILAGAERPLSLAEIAAQGAERLLMPDAFVRDAGALAAALTEDNRRRESAGRKPLFALEGETVSLAAQPEPGERAAAQAAVARGPATAAEVRRGALAALRRRMRECDGATVEWVAARLLEKLGLRELKVAKRGREHVVFTGRRRLGLTDVRHCIRVLRGGAETGRRDVAELRRDIGVYGAQIGLVVGAGDAGREARGEAGAPGQLPVMLLCGEALAEALAEAGVGCRPVVVPEVDEDFFRQAAEAAAEEEGARRARREERERRDEEERRSRRDAREAAAVEAPVVAAEGSGEATAAAPAEAAAGEGPAAEPAGDEPEGPEGDDEEGDEPAEGGAPGGAAPGEGQGPGREGGRRRRRRRRRRGRGGERREGQGAPGGAPAAAAGGGDAAGGGGSPPASPAEPAAPAPAPAGGDGGGGGGGPAA